MHQQIKFTMYLIVCVFGFSANSAFAVLPKLDFGLDVQAKQPEYIGKAETLTPRRTIENFITRYEENDFENLKDLFEVKPGRKLKRQGYNLKRLAEELYTLLSSYSNLEIFSVSNLPEGDLSDLADKDLELVATVQVRALSHDILLKRVTRDGGLSWVFEQHSLEHVPELYSKTQKDRVNDWLTVAPDWVPNFMIFGVSSWALVCFFLGFLFAFILSKILIYPLVILIELMLRRFQHPDAVRFLHKFQAVGWILTLLIFRFVLSLMPIALVARDAIWIGIDIIVTLFFGLFLVRSITAACEYMKHSLLKRRRYNAAHLMPSGEKAMHILVWISVFLVILSNLGFNINGLIAGLGIGGVAIALAGQKTIENLFGGVSVIIDRPVKMGDFCKVGQIEGFVEEIGLRSTRIRTLDRTLVAIPNAEFAQLYLENYALRDRFRYKQTLNLVQRVPASKLKTLKTLVTEILENKTFVDPDPLRVHFKNFGKNDIEFEVITYFRTTDLDQFLDWSEEINLEIKETLDKEGIELHTFDFSGK